MPDRGASLHRRAGRSGRGRGGGRRALHRESPGVGATPAGEGGGVKVFLWHVHGSWTTGFVQGAHEYLVPVLPDRGPDGRGRAQTWEWPESVREVTPAQAREAEVDVLVLQRPHELAG